MYQDMIEYVRNFFQGNNGIASENSVKFPFRDRFDHTMRVYKWAQRINEKEKGDEVVLLTAAIFHDVGKAIKSDLPHAHVSADICDKYLKEIGFPADKREKVVRAVRVHSSKDEKGLDLTLEEKILMDADLCDEVGATAVLWDCMAVAQEDNPNYTKAYEKHLVICEELKSFKKLLKTATGKKLYNKRFSFLNTFIKELKYELGL